MRVVVLSSSNPKIFTAGLDCEHNNSDSDVLSDDVEGKVTDTGALGKTGNIDPARQSLVLREHILV